MKTKKNSRSKFMNLEFKLTKNKDGNLAKELNKLLKDDKYKSKKS